MTTNRDEGVVGRPLEGTKLGGGGKDLYAGDF